MKKVISLYIILLMLFITLTTVSIAQTAAVYAAGSQQIRNNLLSYASINTHALMNFTREFGSIDSARWDRVSDGFIAGFAKKDIQYRVAYDKKGHCISLMRTYNEKKLPADVRARIKSIYYDHNILQVREITASGHLAYIVYLANNMSSLTLRLGDDDTGDMVETEKFIK